MIENTLFMAVMFLTLVPASIIIGLRIYNYFTCRLIPGSPYTYQDVRKKYPKMDEEWYPYVHLMERWPYIVVWHTACGMKRYATEALRLAEVENPPQNAIYKGEIAYSKQTVEERMNGITQRWFTTDDMDADGRSQIGL